MGTTSKPLNDYTVKEIYDNYDELKKQFPRIMATTNYNVILEGRLNRGKNFYAKLKFVEALHQYKEVAQIIPSTEQLSNENIENMMEEILDTVEDVNTKNISKPVKYNSKTKNLTIDDEGIEEEVFDNLMVKFTEITLKNRLNDTIKDTEGNLLECSVFNKGYIDYISRKAIKKRWAIKDNIEYMDIESQTYEGQVFDKLVNIFGEGKILNLNSKSFEEVSKEFKKYGIVNIAKFLKALEYTDKAAVPSEKRELLKNKLDEALEKMEQIKQEEIENSQRKKMGALLGGFEKGLDLCTEWPKAFKIQLSKTLEKNAKRFEYKKIKDKRAEYNGNLKKVTLSKSSKADVFAKYAAIFHEMMHTATTERDKNGNIIRTGLKQVKDNKTIGVGLNEGATEYFANKIYSKLGRREVKVGYQANVQVVKRLIELYGETTILEAMLNGTEKLEKLMEKDGKSYTELNELMDNYHMNRYGKNKENMSKEQIKESLQDVQKFLEELKYNRNTIKENSTINENSIIKEKEAIKEKPTIKDKVFTWFKNVKNKFANIFGNPDEPILLEPSFVISNMEEDEETKDFRESIKAKNKETNTNNEKQSDNYYTKSEYNNEEKEER